MTRPSVRSNMSGIVLVVTAVVVPAQAVPSFSAAHTIVTMPTPTMTGLAALWAASGWVGRVRVGPSSGHLLERASGLVAEDLVGFDGDAFGPAFVGVVEGVLDRGEVDVDGMPVRPTLSRKFRGRPRGCGFESLGPSDQLEP
jgi:hypothetical protein